MKSFLLCLAMLIAVNFSYAQNIFPSSGNVGIGTTSPSYLLDAWISSGPYNTRWYNSNTSTSEYNANVITGAMTSVIGYFGIGGSTVSNPSFRDAFAVGTLSNHPLNLNTGDVARLTILPSGNVGIGTTSPLEKLSVNNTITTLGAISPIVSAELSSSVITGGMYSVVTADGLSVGGAYGAGLSFNTYKNNVGTYEALRITDVGNVGIGTTSPTSFLHISGINAAPSSSGSAQNSSLRIGASTSNLILDMGISASGNLYTWLQSRAQTSYGSNYDMVLNPNGGNVGIGTTNPDEKLAVNGIIHSKEVKIDLTGWPDYVLKKQYQLPLLTAVKSYIDINHHLPDMPSEQEVIKDGLNLGEMNKLLMKKVEELTLYVIDQDKRISQQQKQIETFKLQQQIIDQQNERLKKIEIAIKSK